MGDTELGTPRLSDTRPPSFPSTPVRRSLPVSRGRQEKAHSGCSGIGNLQSAPDLISITPKHEEDGVYLQLTLLKKRRQRFKWI